MSRASAPIVLASSLWACVLLAGCASPGDPTPRHPVVPTPITDLAARQQGNEVVLTFSLPDRSMDREPLDEEPSVEIFRADLAPGAAIDKKTPWRLAYAIPSARVDSYLKEKRIDFHDALVPADLSHEEGAPFAYKVRTRAVKTRASDDSNIRTVRVFPPPAYPGTVRGTVTEFAVELVWTEAAPTSGATLAGYRVYRAQLAPGQESVPRDLSQAKLISPLELIGPSASLQFRDTRFEFGRTYLYTVRTVAAFGGDLVESSDSAPTIVTARDVFPPSAPGGLESAVIPATSQGTAYVELSWAISPEADLAGYRIYRSDQEDKPGDRLNGELLLSPAFRDISVLGGRRYFYRVSAVDRAGNESPLSSVVTADIP